MMISAVAFSQRTNPKLEQVKNDPKTTENAAKADAKMVNQKNVSDKETAKAAFSKKRKATAKKRKSPYRRTA